MKLKLLLVFISSFSMFYSLAGIIGSDGRTETMYVEDSNIRKNARASIAIIEKSKLKKNGDTFFLKEQSLSDNQFINMCDFEHYSSQPMGADCSGFLISDEEIGTAGHCIHDGCQKYYYVFDYVYNSKNEYGFHESKVFECEETTILEFDRVFKNDFARVKLSRAVRLDGVEPLKYSENRTKKDDGLYMIGHPLGIPQKVTRGGKVLDTQEDHSFKHDLDTFGVNSGSPVFNNVTHEVVGILVRGKGGDVMPYSQSSHHHVPGQFGRIPGMEVQQDCQVWAKDSSDQYKEATYIEKIIF